MGFKIKQSVMEDDLYKDRDTQISSINSTFEKAKAPVSCSKCSFLLFKLNSLIFNIDMKIILELN